MFAWNKNDTGERMHCYINTPCIGDYCPADVVPVIKNPGSGGSGGEKDYGFISGMCKGKTSH